MATNIKHTGLLVNTGKRVVVVFRELPDDPTQCLVVDTEAVPDWMHDDIHNAVESPGAQATGNFYEYAERTVFTDGTNMLQTLHTTGRLMKTPTDNVKMTPNNSVSIPNVAPTLRTSSLNNSRNGSTSSNFITSGKPPTLWCDFIVAEGPPVAETDSITSG